MPDGSLWNLVDYIPHHIGAPLRKRGGYSYASNDITATVATATYVSSVMYAEFSGGSKLVIHDEDGRLITVAPPALTVTDVGASLVPAQTPVFHRDRIVITDGTNTPKTYDGSTLGNLAGSPPSAKYAVVYKDRTILARTSSLPNRIYFSAAGNPQSWDTTNSFIDASQPVTGLATLENAILIFTSGRIERLRGSTPPPGTDMVREPLFEVGVVDPWSIVTFHDRVVFANPHGVFSTDGTSLSNLTEKGGIESYWDEIMEGFDSNWRIAGGVYGGGGFYIASIMDGSSFIDCLICHVDTQSWFRFSNIKATSFARQLGAQEELYFGLRSTARVGSFSSTFKPSMDVISDADTTNVEPELETPYYRFVPGKKSWKRTFLSYMMEDAATDNPELELSYITTPHMTDYTTLAPTLGESERLTRARRPLGFASEGIALKVQQANPSADTHLHSIEAELHARESSRL